MKDLFSKTWENIREKTDEYEQLRQQQFEESNHNKSLKEMFAENSGGDAIQREYNESQGTIEYQAIANRKKDDMTVSSHKTLTKKARAMKYISWGFKPFSFFGSFYSMQTEISNSFSVAPTDFATLFIAIALSLLIEVLLHFEATSIFNQREKGLTRIVGTVFFAILISINVYMHFNTAMIMRAEYSSSHEQNIVKDLTSPDAMLIKNKILKIESQITKEEKRVESEEAIVSKQKASLLKQREMYQTSKEYLMSKHESKRARGKAAIAVVDSKLKTLGVTSFKLDDLNEKLEDEQTKLSVMSNEKLSEIKSSGDRAMYVAIVILLIVEIGSRLDLYFYFITRFNLTQAVLAMSKKAFDGLSILEQVQDIFSQFEGRLRVVANQQQQLATNLIQGQERQLDYQLLTISSQRQDSNFTRNMLLDSMDNGYGYNGHGYTEKAYNYDENSKTEEKTEAQLTQELQELHKLLYFHLDDSYQVRFDMNVVGAVLHGKVVAIQTNLLFEDKFNKLKHEIAHILSGTPTHNEQFKDKARELGVKRTTPKATGVIAQSRAYDIYMNIMGLLVNDKTSLELSEEERVELIRLNVIDDSNQLRLPSNIALERMLNG